MYGTYQHDCFVGCVVGDLRCLLSRDRRGRERPACRLSSCLAGAAASPGALLAYLKDSENKRTRDEHTASSRTENKGARELSRRLFMPTERGAEGGRKEGGKARLPFLTQHHQ